MRIGILVTDHIRPEFLPVAGDYTDMVERFLAGRGFEFVRYEVTEKERPSSLGECDAYVATGSRAGVYEDEPWIHGFRDLVVDLFQGGHRYLGICFGSQMIGQALGGQVRKSASGWGVGVKEATVCAAEPWMIPPASSYRCVVSHQDQIEVLPPRARVLAGNDHCQVSMLAMGDHFLGIQGHPEYTPAFGRVMLAYRRERGVVSPEVADPALPTYDTPVDTELLAGWLAGFLQGAAAHP